MTHRTRLMAMAPTVALGILSVSVAQTPTDLWTLMERDDIPTFETLRGELRLEVLTLEFPDASPAPIVTLSDVSMQQPNRLRLNVISPTPDGDGTLACDGEQLTLVSHILRQVARRPAPAHLSELAPEDFALVGEGGVLLAGVLGVEHPLLSRLAADEDVEIQNLGTSERFGALCDAVALETHSGGAEERLTVGFGRQDGFPRWLEYLETSSQGTPWLRITERFAEIEIDGALPSGVFTADVPDDFAELSALDPAAPMRERAAESQ